ncbi:MAG: hypothetical protein AB7O88_26025 [Reyranellaceae bacterium]
MPAFDYTCTQGPRRLSMALSDDDPFWSRGKTMVLCPGCRNLHIVSGPDRTIEQTMEATVENVRRLRRAHDL